MIILDPDLDPDPRPITKTGPTSPESRKAERDTRLPSARTMNTFLREAQTAVRLKGQVSVLLTTDKKIKTLNRNFRGKNKATDVLSFPAVDAMRREVAGDLAVSVDTARRQGTACGHSLAIELKVLILHGLLHLAGYDHETDEGLMARRERTLQARLRLPLGLIERVERGLSSLTLSQEEKRQDGALKVRAAAVRKINAGPSTSPVKGRPASLRMTAAEDRTTPKKKGRRS